MPSGYVGGGSAQFNDIVDGIITDKITESSPEKPKSNSEKGKASGVKSGEFYISGEYDLGRWFYGNAFPVVSAAAYLFLMGGVIAVVWKKIKS